jgi:1-acyl-sn-glycerol-3-phosphate acyltransferase
MVKPRSYGLQNVPDEGAVLLIGNHSTLAFLDMPIMFSEIHRATGRFPRGMADHFHFAIPGWRDLITRAGAVDGTRDNCRELLAAGEAVLVYPGGGREVAKRKGEKYQLIWKQRSGFARLAIENGCPIVPFGAVGAEDSYDIVADADNPLLSPLRLAIERLGGRWDLAIPVVRGIGPTPIPRPERLYFAFGEPIETAPLRGNADDAAVRDVRNRTRHAVEALITTLLEEQATYRKAHP